MEWQLSTIMHVITNRSLSETLSRVEDLRKSEISSIDARYQLQITVLEGKVMRAEESIQEEIQQLQSNLKVQYEAEKKMAIVENMLKLAEVNNKYGELLLENTNLKNTLNAK